MRSRSYSSKATPVMTPGMRSGKVARVNPQLNIKALRHPGMGKAGAVYAGFDAASGDVLMILDADLTMPPEQLVKFWKVIQSQKGEFINGSRLIYPMEHEAMRFLNLVVNKIFALLFTWLLGHRFTDTLCGTKVLRRSDYLRLKSVRTDFGNIDPFGDFDLIFGASKLGLKIIEVPSAMPAAPMAKRKSPVLAMDCCCFAWRGLPFCASRRFKNDLAT